jgi:hypothetical protein
MPRVRFAIFAGLVGLAIASLVDCGGGTSDLVPLPIPSSTTVPVTRLSSVTISDGLSNVSLSIPAGATGQAVTLTYSATAPANVTPLSRGAMRRGALDTPLSNYVLGYITVYAFADTSYPLGTWKAKVLSAVYPSAYTWHLLGWAPGDTEWEDLIDPGSVNGSLVTLTDTDNQVITLAAGQAYKFCIYAEPNGSPVPTPTASPAPTPSPSPTPVGFLNFSFSGPSQTSPNTGANLISFELDGQFPRPAGYIVLYMNIPFPNLTYGNAAIDSLAAYEGLNNGDITGGTLPPDTASGTPKLLAYVDVQNPGSTAVVAAGFPEFIFAGGQGFNGATTCHTDLYEFTGSGYVWTYSGTSASTSSGGVVFGPDLTYGTTPYNLRPGSNIFAVSCE